ncbi:MAG: hypothetical protein HS126_08055 [Anaerolineales bacterium]|nr:hypothetical protein [Anaerolineales bacterium]
MFKTLLRPLLGKGKFPAELLLELHSEGVEFFEEGIWGTITFINYKAPGRRSAWRRSAFVGAIALTSQRIVAFGRSERLLDLPFTHPTIKVVDFRLESPGSFFASFEASHFHSDRSGKIELRFSTSQAAQIMDLLQKRIS